MFENICILNKKNCSISFRGSDGSAPRLLDWRGVNRANWVSFVRPLVEVVFLIYRNFSLLELKSGKLILVLVDFYSQLTCIGYSILKQNLGCSEYFIWTSYIMGNWNIYMMIEIFKVNRNLSQIQLFTLLTYITNRKNIRVVESKLIDIKKSILLRIL